MTTTRFGVAAALVWAATMAATHTGGAAVSYGIPDVQAQAAEKLSVVRQKLDRVLPGAMRAHGFDMWIVVDRENHEDPLHDEVGGGYSGVRGAYVFFDRGAAGIEKIFLGSHEQPNTNIVPQLFDSTRYYGYSRDGLTPLLADVIRARKPRKIGVNTSLTLPEADGLSVGMRDFLVRALGPDYTPRMASAELLVRDFRTRRVPEERELFARLVAWTDRWMGEAFAAIVPGTTTAADMNWWLEQRARDIGLRVGASGSNVPRIVRRGEQLPLASAHPIEPGDIIGIDSGLEYLGYETDLKRTAYVLRPGEVEPPAELAAAWQITLGVADLYAGQMVPGRLGHEVWASIAEQMRKRGYRTVGPDAGGRATTDVRPEVGIYGHSVGNNSHDIGARIAEDLPFAYGERVRFPIVEGEFVSVEFHVSTPIRAWDGRTWYSRFEENARVGARAVEWLVPRQERLLVIGTKGGLTEPRWGQQR